MSGRVHLTFKNRNCTVQFFCLFFFVSFSKRVLEFHYENTPIQIYRKFHLQKLKLSDKKKTLIFFLFLHKT